MSVLTSLIRYFFTHCIIRNSVIIILLTVFLQDFLNAAEVPRKVLVLYDSKTEQSATGNMVFDNFQRPLLARRNDFCLERKSRDWSEEAQLSFLTQAYKGVLDLFGLQKVSENEVKQKLNS